MPHHFAGGHAPRMAMSRMERLLRRLSLSSTQLPDDIYVELVDNLFTALLPIVFMGVATAAVSALVAARQHDQVLGELACASLVITLIRGLTMQAYRRSRRAAKFTAPEVRVWERQYAAGSITFAILLGALCTRFLLENDPVVSLLTTCLVFGYAAGLVTRVAVRPVICVISMVLVVIPIVVLFGIDALRSQAASDIEIYVTQSLLLAGFTVAGLETMVHGYKTTLQQLLTKKDLATLAGRDPLTHLPNRLMLRTRFDDALHAQSRTDRLFAVHCLDLNRFKAVNDNYGHPMGDALLQAVAARLSRTLPASDTIARTGGDEFVVIQAGIRHPGEARFLAQRMVKAVSLPYSLQDQEISIGVSIGIAIAPRDGAEMDQIIGRADAALYQAKRDAGARVVFWGDMTTIVQTATG
jgi:diguanylate cyclase (GGDEF)-like protein